MKRVNKKLSYFYGIYAELFVVLLLKLSGYKIIVRRYRNLYGEIDIIANKGVNLVFVEVKARRKFNSFDLLSKKQLNRIKNSAIFFLSEYGYNKYYSNIRFDIFYITGFYHFHHIKNIIT